MLANILKFGQLSNLSLSNLVGTYHIVFVISGFYYTLISINFAIELPSTKYS
jgi:hypothetical protein